MITIYPVILFTIAYIVLLMIITIIIIIFKK